MNKYLGPLLEAAQKFLRSGLPGIRPISADFPIYRLATGGSFDLINQILSMAYHLINTGHPETTIWSYLAS